MASAATPPPMPQQSTAPPAPLPAAEQPKPGTSRIVRYNGQQVAITTGADENNQPRTYIILPKGGPEVRLTANPDVYAGACDACPEQKVEIINTRET
jgi:hypothetical protein